MRAVVAAFPQGTAGGQYLHARNVQRAMCNVARSSATGRQTRDLYEIDDARCRRTKGAGTGGTCEHTSTF